MKILKFGGTSVGTPERIQEVITIIKTKFDADPNLAIVVSAFAGITDSLIQMGHQASKSDTNYQTLLSKLKERHIKTAQTLIQEPHLSEALDYLTTQFEELTDLLHGVSLIKELSKRSLDLMMSFGERLSAYIITVAMQKTIPSTIYVDARELIKTDNHFGAALVNYAQTYSSIRKYFSTKTGLPIITGFIGSTENGETTTLGRGGSDLTASIFGAGLKAKEIEIWTDVDGVMTADPRKVKQAFPIPLMTYKEALEMSHFGAKVIHPPTIIPALQHHIPIWIKNTLHPKANGTFISQNEQDHEFLISGISSIDSIALLRLEGSGMVGVCGIAMRLFGALAKKEINVILITQGSSEHSICVAIIPQQASLAKESIEEEFNLEIKAGFIDPVIIEQELSIVAAVGENMRQIPGIAGKLFGALGKNGINVVAMVQGSSEYNISIVVKKEDEIKALNVIHEEFFLSRNTTLNVFLVGTGLIGKTLIDQMNKQIPILQKEHAITIKIIGLANSKHMCFDSNGINLKGYQELLHNASEKMDVSTFIKKMKQLNLLNSIFVDCTANDEIAHTYPSILESNISIVTPNKKANSRSYSEYKALKELSKRKGIKFLYETNVGAGLPIISTITDLLKSGDKILKIEAILSGTLSYIFNTFTEEKSFSQVLRLAQEKGFTEPDPREDLNGKDVMRKLLILARESGYPLELEDISIEPILPQDCFTTTHLNEFYQQLEKYNESLENKRAQASRENKVLRYIAKLENGQATIALQAIDKQHPFYHLSGCDNMIALTTERYTETPLVIKGQGAGAAVTAGEVFADIIRIASD